MAISINVDRILKLPGIPERALETVLLLLAVLLISIVGLIPSQSNDALGVELLVLALVFGGVIARLERRSLPKTPQPPSQVLMRIFLIVAATLPMIVGGVTLHAE